MFPRLALLLALTSTLVLGQTGSMALHSLAIQYEGRSYAFTPGGDNIFDIARPPSFNRLRADIQAQVSFAATVGAAPVRIIPSCRVASPSIPNPSSGFIASDPAFFVLDPSGPLTAISFANVNTPTGQFQLEPPPSGTPDADVVYTVTCMLQRSDTFTSIATSAAISFRQTFGARSTVEITGMQPDPTQLLAAGADVAFTADVKYSLPLGAGQVQLGMFDPLAEGPNSFLFFGPMVPVSSAAGTVSVPLMAAVPQRGPIAFRVFLFDTQGNPLASSNDIEYQVLALHIEVTQVLQDDTNDIPLVANKKTVARVFVLGRSNLASLPVELTLQGKAGTGTFSGAAIPFDGALQDARLSNRHAALFVLDRDWTDAGDLQFTARAGLGGGSSAQQSPAGGRAETVTFTTRQQLSIGVIRECEEFPPSSPGEEPETFCPSDSVFSAEGFLRSVFPLAGTAGLAYVPLDVPLVPGGAPPDVLPGLEDLEVIVWRLRTAEFLRNNLIDIVVSWWPKSPDRESGFHYEAGKEGIHIAQVDRLAFDTPAGNASDDEVALAYFVSRSFGGQWAGCASEAQGTPPTTSTIGFDAATLTVRDLTKHPPLGQKDLDESYVTVRNSPRKFHAVEGCQSSAGGPRWMHLQRYATLFVANFDGVFGNGPSSSPLSAEAPRLRRQAVDSDYLLLSGQVSQDGSSDVILPVVRVAPSSSADSPSSQGNFCLEIDSGAPSSAYCFQQDFRNGAVQPFLLRVEAPAGLSAVRLTRDGRTVASLEASANPPTVAITSPAAGATIDATESFELAWTGSDADSDPLLYASLYSPDGGSTWYPLSLETSATTQAVDLSQIAGGGNVLFRVLANDGIHSSEATVGPLTILQNPVPAVAAPVSLGRSAVGVARTSAAPIQNTGSGPLLITAVTSDNPAFVPQANPPFKVLAGTTRALPIEVTPAATGPQRATITLSSNSSTQPSFAFEVLAQGLDADGPVLDLLSAAALTFNDVSVGRLQATSVDVVNRGAAALTLEVSVEGAGFRLAEGASPLRPSPQQSALVLAHNELTSIQIVFEPSAAGESTGQITIASNDPAQPRIEIALSGTAVETGPTPLVSQGGVVDAASFGATLAPGGIASLFGADLAPATALASSIPLPFELEGVEVIVNGAEAPLYFVSANQINFQLPFETPAGAVNVTVRRDGVIGPSVLVAVADFAPAVFVNPNTGEPIVTRHPDGALISAANPARPGDVLILFVTGIGGLSNPPLTGHATPGSPLPTATVAPAVTVGGAPAQVFFGGLAPGLVGLSQVNIQLPATLPANGGSLPLVISFGAASSPPVQLPVAP